MNDDELDNWLLEHNARLVEQTRMSVDLDARHADVLDAAVPAVRVTVGRSARRLTTLAVAVCVAAGVATSLFSATPTTEPVIAIPMRGSDKLDAGAFVAFRQVSGPAGLTTMAPVDWKARATTHPGEVFEVRDPDNPDRYLRYGAILAARTIPITDLDESERSFAAGYENYERIRLRPTTFNGADADEWEFLFDEDGEQQHTYVLYWNVGSYRYLILASAPASQWDAMAPILDRVRERTEVAVGAP